MTTIALFGGWQAVPSIDMLRTALPGDRIVGIEAGEDPGGASEAEILLGSGNADRIAAILATAPKVRWVHTFSAGVDRLVATGLIRREGVVFTNNSGAYDIPIAEHVMAMLFTIARGLPAYLAAQRKGEWIHGVPHAELRDATLVVLGLGSIGGELARVASGAGMRVIGVRRNASRSAPGVERTVSPDRLVEVAREADYLAVTAALTPLTEGMVSAEVIAALKPTAWLVNIARGPIVDEAALLGALREHRIGGAGLDVFDVEPLPADSPFWTLDNVILTPHVSGNSPRVRERSLALVVENVRRFKAGETLLNVVDRDAGY